MKYAVYRQWKYARTQEVLEYFESYEQACNYARTIRPSVMYSVGIGEFVRTFGE